MIFRKSFQALSKQFTPTQYFSNNLLSKDGKIEVLYTQGNDIHINLAVEEWLYEHQDLQHPVLFLWRNDKTIVIGRHQNPWKECFIQNMEKDNIKLSRRRTGGGAVYQDLGNSCFSFLTPVFDLSAPLDSKNKNNQILIDTLKDLKIDAEISGRNDILCKGKKISGSAYKVNLGTKGGKGKKALHHGTMLINVDSSNVPKYLNPNKEKLKSKGIDSVISRIINLSEVDPTLSHERFCKSMEKSFLEYYSGLTPIIREISLSEVTGNTTIRDIYNEMQSWEWLYGSTPKFTNNFETRFEWGIMDVYFEVKGNVIQKGQVSHYITNYQIFSDCLYADFITKMNDLVNSKQYQYDFRGMQEFCKDIRVDLDNELLEGYTKMFEEWIKKTI